MELEACASAGVLREAPVRPRKAIDKIMVKRRSSKLEDKTDRDRRWNEARRLNWSQGGILEAESRQVLAATSVAVSLIDRLFPYCILT